MDADLAAVSDNPEWTEEDFANSLPFYVRFPELAASLHESGPLISGASEFLVPVGIERDLIERLKAGGSGCEARLNDMVRKAIEAG